MSSPPARIVPKRLALSRRDKEFLPGALEILETPPSPIQSAMIYAICALAVAALLWAYLGRIDIIAVAQGKIQPIGRTKVIQPLETGKVQLVKVASGSKVKAGDVLVELDAREAESDDAALIDTLWALKAEIKRRTIALAASQNHELSPVPTIEWQADMPALFRAREQRVLEGDLDALAADVASLTAQSGEKAAEAARMAETVASERKLIATLKERVDMRSTLVQLNAGSKSNLIDAQEQLQTQDTYLTGLEGQEKQARAGLEVVRRDIGKTFGKFMADNGQKRADAERKMDEVIHNIAKARVRISHMVLTSPIDGTVQGSVITSPGQVVTVGEEIMQIVPHDADLEIEGYLLNQDIGFVKTGDIAQVKVQSFPFTRYGTLEATVTRVAKDAIPEPDAQQREANSAAAGKSVLFGGAQRTQNLVFPVTLALSRKTMNIDGAEVSLTPGMAVTVEIKTGSRRILEYLFSPLAEVASQAGKER